MNVASCCCRSLACSHMLATLSIGLTHQRSCVPPCLCLKQHASVVSLPYALPVNISHHLLSMRHNIYILIWISCGWVFLLAQGLSDDEEIDWSHFTFQHGFRQLPQQLPHHLHQQLGPTSSSVPPATLTTDVDMSEYSHSPSPSTLGSLPAAMKQESGLTPNLEETPRPPVTTDHSAHNFKQESTQHAQHTDVALNRQGHAELKEEDAGQQAGDIGAAADGEGEQHEGQESDEESIEGQRLTRSRRGNAAGLYMLDHGSQLVPKKVLALAHMVSRAPCCCCVESVASPSPLLLSAHIASALHSNWHKYLSCHGHCST